MMKMITIFMEREEAENPVVLKKLVQLKQCVRADNEWAYEEYLFRSTQVSKGIQQLRGGRNDD